MESTINLQAIYIVDTMAMLLCALMLTTKSWKLHLNQYEKKYFSALIVIIMFSCIMDACCFAFDGKTNTFAFFMNYFSNYWIFSANLIITPLWLLIVLSHITGNKPNKNKIIVILIICITGLILLVINAFNGMLFYIDESNVYHRGPIYLLFTFVDIAFILYGVIIYLYNRKKNPDLRRFPLLHFIIPTIIGVGIQYFFYGVSTIMSFLSVSITAMIFGFNNEADFEMQVMKEKQENLETIKEQNRQLEEQQIKLEETAKLANAANNAKTTFLNNMSHDIRTPMNAITGYTNLAKKHIDNTDQVVDYLNKIESSSSHLLSLINDVLDMSRIESGKMHLNETQEDLLEIVNNLSSMIQADLSKKDLSLTTDFGGISNPYVLVDKLRLNQIILNILSNSIKYTPNGGHLLFKVFNDDNNYTFIIKDDGIGMSDEFLKTIYEPFTRVNSSTVSGIQGTGLGMAITKNFIDMMNGKIDIKSKENQGTETIISFELSTFDKPIEITDDQQITYDFKGKKLLLVEDNALNREIAIEVLQEQGFIVDTAEDGTFAVEKMKSANKDTYDLILMDVQMPIMNGYDATKAIRSLDSEINTIPIIAMTANAFDEDKKEAKEAGMNDYISKPIDIDQMNKTLAKYL